MRTLTGLVLLTGMIGLAAWQEALRPDWIAVTEGGTTNLRAAGFQYPAFLHRKPFVPTVRPDNARPGKPETRTRLSDERNRLYALVRAQEKYIAALEKLVGLNQPALVTAIAAKADENPLRLLEEIDRLRTLVARQKAYITVLEARLKKQE